MVGNAGSMKTIHKIWPAEFFGCGGGVLAMPQFAASRRTSRRPLSTRKRERCPAPTMEATLFPEHSDLQRLHHCRPHEKVLYQQPCYCHCDRSQDTVACSTCFVSRHGSAAISARRKIFIRRADRKGRLPRKSAKASSRANGRRWIPRSMQRIICRRYYTAK